MSYYTDFAQGLKGLSDIELDDLFNHMSCYATDGVTSPSRGQSRVDEPLPSSAEPFAEPLEKSF